MSQRKLRPAILCFGTIKIPKTHKGIDVTYISEVAVA